MLRLTLYFAAINRLQDGQYQLALPFEPIFPTIQELLAFYSSGKHATIKLKRILRPTRPCEYSNHSLPSYYISAVIWCSVDRYRWQFPVPVSWDSPRRRRRKQEEKKEGTDLYNPHCQHCGGWNKYVEYKHHDKVKLVYPNISFAYTAVSGQFTNLHRAILERDVSKILISKQLKGHKDTREMLQVQFYNIYNNIYNMCWPVCTKSL